MKQYALKDNLKMTVTRVLLIAEYTSCSGIAMWWDYSFYYNFDDINFRLMSFLHILYIHSKVWVSDYQ